MVAPATLQIAGEFGVTSTAIIAMMTSVFVLGYGKLCAQFFRRDAFESTRFL